MIYTLLVVDDETDILDSLERQFRKQYKVLKASSAAEALQKLQKETVHIVISDQRMPDITGVQLLERAQKIQPDAIRILLTGFTDVSSIIAAINKGQIYRYITKPWDPTELDIIVSKAAETYTLRKDLKDKNDQLEKAYSELKSLDDAKSRFMLLIGHELKTPLTTLRSFLELLKEEKLTQDAEKYVGRLFQATDRLQNIVFDVLDLMAADTGQSPVKKEAHRISPLISEIVSQFKTETEKKGLIINFQDPKDVVQIDRILIRKVINKLIQNAVRFTPDNNEIEIKSTPINGKKLSISISNKSETMNQEKVDSLLKPFAIDENILNHSKGLGLGLSVCQSLLKHHGSTFNLSVSKNIVTASFVLELA